MSKQFLPYLMIASLLWIGLSPRNAAAQQKTMVPPEFNQWLPLSDAERDLKAPVVEKNAGAEVLLWRVHVVDELLGDNRSFQRVFYHYIRMKIFDDSGKEKAATIDLPYREPGGVIDISGHTIRADGSVIELDRKTVYKRNVERVGGRRESVVSFAMPGVEKGAILEYRWKQTEDDNRFRYVRLMFQREFPVQKVTYFVKPLDSQYVVNEQLFLARFNCTPTPIKVERDGYDSTTLENVAAAKFETFSPSDPNVQPWALLYYREGGMKESTKYWDEQGKSLYRSFREEVKNDGETKAAAVTAVGSATDENAKLTSIAAFVRSAVRNVNDPGVSTAEREAFYKGSPKDRRRTSTEVLKSAIGMPRELNLVFGAIGASTVKKVATESHPEDNRLSVNLDLAADRFGQSMQGRLFIVRPGMLSSGGDYTFTTKQRTAPVQLEADYRRDTVRIKLPQGYKLDELPSPAKLAAPYGTLEASWAVRDGEVVMDRTLELKQMTVPPTEYAKVREFFDHVLGAEFAPVVLVKQ